VASKVELVLTHYSHVTHQNLATATHPTPMHWNGTHERLCHGALSGLDLQGARFPRAGALGCPTYCPFRAFFSFTLFEGSMEISAESNPL